MKTVEEVANEVVLKVVRTSLEDCPSGGDYIRDVGSKGQDRMIFDHENYWRCGDCRRKIPSTEEWCNRPLDDYLGVRGVKTVEEAISKAVEKGLEELLSECARKYGPRNKNET